MTWALSYGDRPRRARYRVGQCVRVREIIWLDGDCPEVGDGGRVEQILKFPWDPRPRVEVRFDDGVVRSMDERELEPRKVGT